MNFFSLDVMGMAQELQETRRVRTVVPGSESATGKARITLNEPWLEKHRNTLCPEERFDLDRNRWKYSMHEL